MQRITISLPDEAAEILAREARRNGLSLSALIRQTISKVIPLSSDAPVSLPFVALGRSGTNHTARDAEAILAKEWNDAQTRGR